MESIYVEAQAEIIPGVTKRCTKCGEVKAVGEFYNNKNSCKACYKSMALKYQTSEAGNKKRKEQKKKRMLKNPEKWKQIKRIEYIKKREKNRKQQIEKIKKIVDSGYVRIKDYCEPVHFKYVFRHSNKICVGGLAGGQSAYAKKEEVDELIKKHIKIKEHHKKTREEILERGRLAYKKRYYENRDREIERVRIYKKNNPESVKNWRKTDLISGKASARAYIYSRGLSNAIVGDETFRLIANLVVLKRAKRNIVKSRMEVSE